MAEGQKRCVVTCEVLPHVLSRFVIEISNGEQVARDFDSGAQEELSFVDIFWSDSY